MPIPGQNHVSKACSLERGVAPSFKRNIHPGEHAAIRTRIYVQQCLYNIIFNRSCANILSTPIPYPGLQTCEIRRDGFEDQDAESHPALLLRFLSTCPKSYTFELLGCLQAVTPLLKFMPQFHSVTPLICSGSQETGQAGASGESQPWVPKGQGETQAARPNRKQLPSSCSGEPFR